jgi:hypothetical protein
MAINLAKGQRISMDKGLSLVGVGLGWDPNTNGGYDFDLDASAFMLGANGKIPADEYFVFYNNTPKFFILLRIYILSQIDNIFIVYFRRVNIYNFVDFHFITITKIFFVFFRKIFRKATDFCVFINIM